MRTLAILLLLGCVAPPAPARAQGAVYAELVAAYQRGAFDDAVDALLKMPMSNARQREIREWIRLQAKDKRVDAITAALMLHSEAVFVGHAQAPGLAEFTNSGRINQELVGELHRTLKVLAPRTNFTRVWYLMWESFRQGFERPEIDRQTDFLPDALEAFPDDAYIFLAAGSRYELYWWVSPDNALRDPSAAENVDSRHLRSAEEWLRKSVGKDPALAEARLRLARVLTVRGSLEAAQNELAQIKTDDPNYRYLAELFLGRVRERAGDPEGASAAYARAVGLVETPEAARIAAAQVAHGSGRRAEAAAVLTQSLVARPAAVDPWTAYVRGQWWYLQNRMRRARALVVSAATATAK